MNIITVFVTPNRLDHVVASLRDQNLRFFVSTLATEYFPVDSQVMPPFATPRSGHSSRVRIEVLVESQHAEKALEAIRKAANTSIEGMIDGFAYLSDVIGNVIIETPRTPFTW